MLSGITLEDMDTVCILQTRRDSVHTSANVIRNHVNFDCFDRLSHQQASSTCGTPAVVETEVRTRKSKRQVLCFVFVLWRLYKEN